MASTITIDFDDAGNPIIEVGGTVGKGCKALTEALQKSLGVTTDDKLKPEYHRVEVIKNVVSQ